MNLIQELSGELTQGDYREPRGMVTAVHVEPAPGVHIQIILGAAGLLFRRCDAAVALPTDSLLKLACEKCPALIATAAAPEKAETISDLAKKIVAQNQAGQKTNTPPTA